jgi:metal-sulfur cluster biosynthetic enzyme
LNVLQLGLIRKVWIENDNAKMYVLLTTPFCPYGPAMLEMIRQKASEGLGMPVIIELGVEPWDFSLMEDPSALDWGMYT